MSSILGGSRKTYVRLPVNKKFFDHFNLLGIASLPDPSIVNMSFNMSPSSKYDRGRNVGKIPLRDIIDNQAIEQLPLDKGRIFEAS